MATGVPGTYLRLLTAAGVLATSEDTYTIVHFLDAHPTAGRRTEHLAKVRNKVCKRQSKHRMHLQDLQAEPLQNIDLSGLSPSRHAHKPQTTEQAVPAAHAATHQPTTEAPPRVPRGTQQVSKRSAAAR